MSQSWCGPEIPRAFSALFGARPMMRRCPARRPVRTLADSSPSTGVECGHGRRPSGSRVTHARHRPLAWKRPTRSYQTTSAISTFGTERRRRLSRRRAARSARALQRGEDPALPRLPPARWRWRRSWSRTASQISISLPRRGEALHVDAMPHRIARVLRARPGHARRRELECVLLADERREQRGAHRRPRGRPAAPCRRLRLAARPPP